MAVAPHDPFPTLGETIEGISAEAMPTERSIGFDSIGFSSYSRSRAECFGMRNIGQGYK
jgi:hypothetical protein